jgi:D-alanyl-D-alanine carboxypeptidase (penicillin-binding protein 5/6)
MQKKVTTTQEPIIDEKLAIELSTNKIPVAQQLVLLAVILLLIFAGAVTPKLIAFIEKTESAPAATGEFVTDLLQSGSKEEAPETPFGNIDITAKAAYVWDINNQKALYKKDESKQLPLASITKLMTALVANEVLDEKEDIEINNLSIRQDGDSGLHEGEVFDRLSLSDLVLMSSSNDGAFALAAAAGNIIAPNTGARTFVDAMNLRATEIGLKETYFKNPTGLDISPNEGGAYGSARDVAFLMEYIVLYEPDILTFTREDQARVYSQNGDYHDAENTNYYIDEIPGLIGSKTGYTDLAGGNLVIAFNAGLNRPIAAVVLGSTQQDRFTDIIELVEETQKYVTLQSAQ